MKSPIVNLAWIQNVSGVYWHYVVQPDAIRTHGTIGDLKKDTVKQAGDDEFYPGGNKLDPFKKTGGEE